MKFAFRVLAIVVDADSLARPYVTARRANHSIDRFPVQPHFEKYSASRFTQIKSISIAVPPQRGAFCDQCEPCCSRPGSRNTLHDAWWDALRCQLPGKHKRRYFALTQEPRALQSTINHAVSWECSGNPCGCPSNAW
jgi:hypothetical protein